MSAVLETQNDANANFEALHQQLMDDKNAVSESKTSEVDVGEQAADGERVDRGSQERRGSSDKKESKKIRFQKGEQVWDIDEDAIAEIKADKSIRSLSAREMRDKSSGEIAIENRMKELAEKRKEQDAFVKRFTETAKKDPIRALEQMMEFASKADPELNFNSYVQSLIQQAESLSGMTEAERKAWDLDRKVKEKDEIIKQKEEKEVFDLRRQEFADEAEISTDEFDNMARMVLEDPEIAKNVGSMDDLFKIVDQFHYEVQAQQAAYAALNKVSKGIAKDDPYVFELADVLKKNPDFEPSDVQDIVRELFMEQKREKAAKTLSRKQRSTVSDEDYRTENLSPFEFLMRELQRDRDKKTTK
jgi:hypothetical protein